MTIVLLTLLLPTLSSHSGIPHLHNTGNSSLPLEVKFIYTHHLFLKHQQNEYCQKDQGHSTAQLVHLAEQPSSACLLTFLLVFLHLLMTYFPSLCHLSGTKYKRADINLLKKTSESPIRIVGFCLMIFRNSQRYLSNYQNTMEDYWAHPNYNIIQKIIFNLSKTKPLPLIQKF